MCDHKKYIIIHINPKSNKTFYLENIRIPDIVWCNNRDAAKEFDMKIDAYRYLNQLKNEKWFVSSDFWIVENVSKSIGSIGGLTTTTADPTSAYDHAMGII